MRTVVLPPSDGQRSDGTLSGGWWHDADDGRMVCDLCPRKCSLKPGDRGFCFVRQNRDGEMVLTTYGKSTGFCIDPIEKKPLNHFYPGTSVLSFGTAGCNLGCKFCQNHDISKARKVELLSEEATPEAIARAAVELECKSVAYTYNDPIIWAEYAIDTAKECRKVGVKSVAVTAGYITPEARAPFFEYFDAANVDLKAFTEEFYDKITLSHLQPVLDTLEWLHRETDVWVEITNLIIPDANDSEDELRKLCDWVTQHVGDEVPIHFSAFHPDFRMLDRPRTPHETLIRAYDIAKSAGIKYVYVGNVHDEQRDSTYCNECGKLVIRRDWYELSAYHLKDGDCGHCGSPVPGRFGSGAGSWGRKRQRVEIAKYANVESELRTSEGDTVTTTTPKPGNLMSLTTEQESKVLYAACEFVAAAVTKRPISLPDANLSGAAQNQVDGVYVSLKRDGRLRGCCGFTGTTAPLIQGIKHSADRTALEDPRMPPVSSTELAHLDVEVWILGGLIPVNSTGEARLHEIKVGRDGLLIQRGEQRGLLLPGVATDNDWDEETFLCQVGVKAKLPPTAWREPDTKLQRFEGIVVKGKFVPEVVKLCPIDLARVVSSSDVTLLAGFCRENIKLLHQGAQPNYYLQGVEDGMVNGVLLTATTQQGQQLSMSKITLRPPMPLQSTLFGMCEELVRGTQQRGMDATTMKIDVAVLEDPTMNGTSQQPDLRGVTKDRALFAMGPGQMSALRFDASSAPEENCAKMVEAMAMRDDQLASLFSFATQSTQPIHLVNKVQPQRGPDVRPPALAGKFYPATAAELSSTVQQMLPNPLPEKYAWRAAMVPHAGLRYSGRLAAEVLAHLEMTKSIIVIGPKHTRHGVDWAVAPHVTWTAPGIEIENDRELAERLTENIDHLQPDGAAHHQEHCIEVELPFLKHFAPDSKVVGIAMGGGSYESCQAFGAGLAKTLDEADDPTLVLISSDMNHFASDAESRRLDELALEAIESLDTHRLFQTCRDNDISMCGLLPAVVTLEALQQLKPIGEARRVNYATSADVTGDKSRVVGYAGMLFD